MLALRKYLEFPIVNKRSTVIIQKVEKLIYNCCQNQYDPNTDNDVRIESSDIYGGPIEIKPKKEKYELRVFQIQLKIQHDLKDKDTCTYYAKMNSSYQECLEDLLEKNLKATLDCVPPWMPSRYNNVCNKSISNLNKSTFTKYDTDMTDLFIRRNVDMLKECKVPCTKTRMYVTNLYHKSNYPHYGQILIQFNPTIEIKQEMYSYDVFALVVELGSALGLWIGLSALSLVDLFILYSGIIAATLIKFYKLI